MESHHVYIRFRKDSINLHFLENTKHLKSLPEVFFSHKIPLIIEPSFSYGFPMVFLQLCQSLPEGSHPPKRNIAIAGGARCLTMTTQRFMPSSRQVVGENGRQEKNSESILYNLHDIISVYIDIFIYTYRYMSRLVSMYLYVFVRIY